MSQLWGGMMQQSEHGDNSLSVKDAFQENSISLSALEILADDAKYLENYQM